MTSSCPLGGCPASRDLTAEVNRLRSLLDPQDTPTAPVKGPRTAVGAETVPKYPQPVNGPQAPCWTCGPDPDVGTPCGQTTTPRKEENQ